MFKRKLKVPFDVLYNLSEKLISKSFNEFKEKLSRMYLLITETIHKRPEFALAYHDKITVDNINEEGKQLSVCFNSKQSKN